MRIALVHDDLVQWGGAERVLTGLSEAFPEADIFTSVFDDRNPILQGSFAGRKIFTSFLQQIPGWKKLYKTLLPLYPIAFEQFDFSKYDVVISHSTRFAKAIITKPETLHICYCPTPPRFLWNFSKQEIPFLIKPYLSFLRIYDQVAANRVDLWVANSVNVKKRIKKVYQNEARVIYPFVDVKKLSQIETFDGGYLLVICRLNEYKRVDLAIEVANELKIPLKIIGVGPKLLELKKIAQPWVEFLGFLTEDLLLSTLAGCRALLVPGEEDFGLTPIEAAAMGKPVLAFRKGGAIETVIDGKTGYFFEEQSIRGVIEALEKLEKAGYDKKQCYRKAVQFSKERFIGEFQGLLKSLV